MKLIVGLGNPDKKYLKTRHNIGWQIIDKLAIELVGKKKIKWHESKKAKALYFKTEVDYQEVELIKPLTYMNLSGVSVAYAVKKHSIDVNKDLIVVHDDKDIQLGKIKVQSDHSAGGHNGVASIIEHLGTRNFTRVKVGVANTRTNQEDTAEFVLKKFGWLEKKSLRQTIEQAIIKIKELI